MPLLKGITGLRGFAAIWVVYLHFGPQLIGVLPALTPFKALWNAGGTGVDIFFVLSGFVMLHAYLYRYDSFSLAEYREFVWFRFARIYPAYIVALLLMIIGVFWVFPVKEYALEEGRFPLLNLPLEAAMMHMWGVGKLFGWNYPDWSVSVEWLGYLVVFPIALYIVKNLQLSRLGWLLVGLMLSLIAWHVAWSDLVPVGLRKNALFTVEFALGATAYVIYKNELIPARYRGFFVPIALTALLVGAYWPTRLTGAGVYAWVTLLVLGLAYEEGPWARLFSLRPVVLMGEISYSLYLIHAVLQEFEVRLYPLEDFTKRDLMSRCLAVIGLHLAIGFFAFVLWRLVEVPARAYLRRVWANRQSSLYAGIVPAPRPN